MNSKTKYLLVKFKGPRAKKYKRKFLKKPSKQKKCFSMICKQVCTHKFSGNNNNKLIDSTSAHLQ